MPRTPFVVAGWVAATAAAVAVAWAGVDAVAGRVVDPLPPTLGLATGAGPSDGPDGAGPADDGTRSEVATPSERPPSGGPTAAPDGPAGRPRGADASPPEASPPSPSEDPPPPVAEVRSYAVEGGSATLRWAGGVVQVVAAEPTQGWTVEVTGAGTPDVQVEFRSDDDRSRIRGRYVDGAPSDRVDEDADHGSDDGDEDDREDDRDDD